MKKQMKKQMIRRIIVIAIAVCVVLALVLPLFVKADVAIGGDVNYRDADYYVVTDGPDGYVEMYYGPGLEYGVDYEIGNGKTLHIIETAENFYDMLEWGRAESDDYSRWVRLDHTELQGSIWKVILWQLKRLLAGIAELIRSLR